jgi:hypothetical protein
VEAVLVRERRCEKSVLEGRRDIRGAALTTARPVNNRRASGESAPKREPRREPRFSLTALPHGRSEMAMRDAGVRL